MQYSLIRFPESVVNAREKSIAVDTMFSGIYYMAKSRMKIGKPDEYGIVNVYIPAWMFINNGINACQVVNGNFVHNVKL